MDAYNARMRDYAAKNPPFPGDLVVTYTRRAGRDTAKIEITRAAVRRYTTEEPHARGKMRTQGNWRPVQSRIAQRFRVGVLAQRVASEPMRTASAMTRRGGALRITRAGEDWFVSWSRGERPPELSSLLEGIQEIQ